MIHYLKNLGKLLLIFPFIIIIGNLNSDPVTGRVYQEYRNIFKKIDVYKYLNASYTIKLSQDGTLKDFFDSGVRTYRFPGLERTTLEFTNSYVIFEDARGYQTISLPAQWVSLAILNEGLLATVEARSVPLTLKEAEVMMMEYLKFGKRTQADLTEFLAAVEKNHISFPDPPSKFQHRFGFGWDSGAGHSYYVSFQESFQKERPLSFNLILNWSKHRKPIVMRKRYPGSIPPPKEYSHISMEAPEIFGPGTYLYDTKNKKIRGHNKESPEHHNVEFDQNNILLRHDEKNKKMANEKNSTSSIGIVIVGLILIVITLGLFFKKLHS